MHERVVWRVFVKDVGTELIFIWKKLRKRKDGLKQTREGNGTSLQSQLSLLCDIEPGWDYVRQSNAGQVNHTMERYAWCCGAGTAIPTLIVIAYSKSRDYTNNTSDSCRETPQDNMDTANYT